MTQGEEQRLLLRQPHSAITGSWWSTAMKKLDTHHIRERVGRSDL